MQQTAGAETRTYNILLLIIEQEVEHEEELQSLLGDIELMVEHK